MKPKEGMCATYDDMIGTIVFICSSYCVLQLKSDTAPKVLIYRENYDQIVEIDCESIR